MVFWSPLTSRSSDDSPRRALRLHLDPALSSLVGRATPVLILDEIDKVNPGNYDPAPMLLDLLEPASARPSGDELADVIRSAWLAHRGEYPGLRLPRELPDCAVDGLAKGFTSIRDLQRRFEDAVARAARRPGRLQLLPSDLAGTSPLKLVRSGT